jgi:hypothetical protein
MRDRVYEEGMGQPPMDDSMGSMDMGMKKPRPKNESGSKRRPSEAKKPAKKMAVGGKVYAKGGYVKAADGCAIKGKTKGKMC